jgi:hypothetical protein
MRLFYGHVEADRIDAALATLVALGAWSQSGPIGGRPSTRWAAIPATQYEENAEDEEP